MGGCLTFSNESHFEQYKHQDLSLSNNLLPFQVQLADCPFPSVKITSTDRQLYSGSIGGWTFTGIQLFIIKNSNFQEQFLPR